MYKIKQEKKKELLSGRTMVYIAEITGYTRVYINEVFLGARNIKEETVKKILEAICNDSVKLNQKLNKEGIEKVLKYFFEKVD